MVKTAQMVIEALAAHDQLDHGVLLQGTEIMLVEGIS